MRRVWASIALAMVLVLGGLSAGTRTAVAHASMTGSDPPNNAVIAEAPETMVVTFNEPVAPLTMRLIAPGGAVQDLSDVAADGNSLRVRLPDGLGRGTHLLSWRVVSADGHPVGGSVTFSIGEPTVGPAELADLRRQRDAGIRDGAIWLCKLALYLGLMFGCGGAFYAAFISGGPLVADPPAHCRDRPRGGPGRDIPVGRPARQRRLRHAAVRAARHGPVAEGLGDGLWADGADRAGGALARRGVAQCASVH